MKMGCVLALSIATACGQVSDQDAVDAQPSDAPPQCTGDSTDACGPRCEVCEAFSDREVPTCDGTACGFECAAAAPRCNDGSCSRLLWSFDSGMVDDVVARDPTDLPLRVDTNLGSQALAIDLTALTEIAFTIPICNTGAIDFSDKSLRFDVLFDGGNTQGLQYFVQASVPSPMAGAFLGTTSIQAGINTAVSAAFADSTFSGDATAFTIQAGSFGAAFAGTIWFDNFRIE